MIRHASAAANILLPSYGYENTHDYQHQHITPSSLPPLFSLLPPFSIIPIHLHAVHLPVACHERYKLMTGEEQKYC